MRSRVEYSKVRSVDAGFTFIELALVLVVVGILAVVTIPKYDGIVEHYRLESSAQTLVSELRYAKQLAIEQRGTYYVGVTENGVQILNGSPITALDRVGPETLWQKNVQLDTAHTSGLSGLKDMNSILYEGMSYNWMGHVVVPGIATPTDIVVVLRGGLGHEVEIHISALTGNLTLVWP